MDHADPRATALESHAATLDPAVHCLRLPEHIPWRIAMHSAPGDDARSGDLRLDTSVAQSARVYDYWLGGKDHFPADRKAAEDVARLRPQVVAGAHANRAYLARVVRYLAVGCGVRQFLDIGAGLPFPGNTHEVAQQVAADCRVTYVDNDALVLTHARALLTSTPPGSCDYIEADLRDTATIVAQAARTLDLAQPVAVMLLAVLHFIPDSDDPAALVAKLTGQLVPGSFIAISHLTADFAPEQVTAAAAAYNDQAPVPVTARTHAQVTGLFGGLPLVAPGVVPVTGWRPPVAGLPHRMTADLYAGLARIPGVHR
jgi:S-adenosyl methyltransferase